MLAAGRDAPVPDPSRLAVPGPNWANLQGLPRICNPRAAEFGDNRAMMADLLDWLLRGIARLLLEVAGQVPSSRWEGTSPLWAWSIAALVCLGVVALVAALVTGETWLYRPALGALAAAFGLAIAAAIRPRSRRGDRTPRS